MRRFIEATVRASALPTLALTLVAFTSLPAQASLYSSLVVFGDSLSDSGNNALAGLFDPNQLITGNTYIPTNTYAPMTYSNGLVWASDVASRRDHRRSSAHPSLSGQPISRRDERYGLAQCALCYRGRWQQRASRAHRDSGGGRQRGQRSCQPRSHSQPTSAQLSTNLN